jgi:hypothetical protein
MRATLRAFRSGRKPGLLLEAYATEEGIPYYWAGQPATKPRQFRIALAWLLAVPTVLQLWLTGYGSPFLYVTIALAVVMYPVILIRDWVDVEYVVGPTHILARLSGMQREPSITPTGPFNAIDVQQSRLQARFDCCDVTFCTRKPDDKDPEKMVVTGRVLTLRDVPAREAAFLLTAFEHQDADKAPEDLVREQGERRRQIERALPT